MSRSPTRASQFEQREEAARREARHGSPPKSRGGPGAEPPVPRHEAIWLDGRVPNGYWDQPEHRRRYVRWLGQQLGVRRPQDWYRVTTDDFKNNGGGGLLHYWHDSAVGAVQDTYPDYDWKEWLFQTAPRRFWLQRRNHRLFMEWLEKRLDIREPEDWYRVTNQDFRDHGGGAFLLHYDSTISAAIMAYRPDYDWKEWMFDKTPKGFWDQRRNRRRYLQWLEAQLGYQSPDDWYAVTTSDFAANYGNQFLKHYGGSPMAALQDCFPRRTWLEWRFARVPAGFWDNRNNCQSYIRWLGKQLKIRRVQDWRQVRRRDVVVNYGSGLLAMYHSHWALLVEFVPGLRGRTAAAGKAGVSSAGRQRRERDARPAAKAQPRNRK